MKTKNELYQDFKDEEMPVFKYMGLSQGLCFGLLLLSLPCFIWINFWLLIKIDGSLLVLILIIGGVYRWLEKAARKIFDETFLERENEV